MSGWLLLLLVVSFSKYTKMPKWSMCVRWHHSHTHTPNIPSSADIWRTHACTNVYALVPNFKIKFFAQPTLNAKITAKLVCWIQNEHQQIKQNFFFFSVFNGKQTRSFPCQWVITNAIHASICIFSGKNQTKQWTTGQHFYFLFPLPDLLCQENLHIILLFSSPFFLVSKFFESVCCRSPSLSHRKIAVISHIVISISRAILATEMYNVNLCLRSSCIYLSILSWFDVMKTKY